MTTLAEGLQEFQQTNDEMIAILVREGFVCKFLAIFVTLFWLTGLI